MKQIILITFFCLSVLTLFAQKNRVDYRYAPDWHVTTPAFPDDTCKTLVGPVGFNFYMIMEEKYFILMHWKKVFVWSFTFCRMRG